MVLFYFSVAFDDEFLKPCTSRMNGSGDLRKLPIPAKETFF